MFGLDTTIAKRRSVKCDNIAGTDDDDDDVDAKQVMRRIGYLKLI